MWEDLVCCDLEELELVTRENQEGMSSIKVVIPEDLKGRFKSLCALRHVSMNDVLANFIEEWVKENENSPQPDNLQS
jgi:ParG